MSNCVGVVSMNNNRDEIVGVFIWEVEPDVFLYKYPNGLNPVIIHTYTAYADGTVCSETPTYKIQTAGKHPKLRIHHLLKPVEIFRILAMFIGNADNNSCLIPIILFLCCSKTFASSYSLTVHWKCQTYVLLCQTGAWIYHKTTMKTPVTTFPWFLVIPLMALWISVPQHCTADTWLSKFRNMPLLHHDSHSVLT